MYYVIYLTETDGDCQIKSFETFRDLSKWVCERSLWMHDFAVISGKMLKDFPDNIVLHGKSP